MIHYFKLIRPVNLFVLALTMLLFRYCIVNVDVYELYDFKPYLSDTGFYILLLVTLLVAAGGYVINDIMDVDTDRINRGDRLIIEQYIDENSAFNFYKVLVAAAIISTIALMIVTKQLKLSGIPLVVMVLLYLYAQIFKRMAFVGNLVIAICAGLPVLMIAIYEFKINEYDTNLMILFTRGIGLAAFYYGGFAFLTTLAREIIKDIEDMEGDLAIDARTLPISAGVGVSKTIVLVIQLVILTLLACTGFYLLAIRAAYPFYGLLLMLVLPLVVQMILVVIAKTPEQFKRAGDLGKVHMLLGVLSMIFFYSGSAPLFFNELMNHIAKWIS